MNLINNFLTSGYHFSKDENLQRFRFSLLNSMLIISAFFTLLHFLSSTFGFITYHPVYVKLLFFYDIACIFTLFFLRTKKSYYSLAVNTIVLSSLILFYGALFFGMEDKFRLIWFFLVVFASFVLLGKKYGIILMSLVLISILTFTRLYELGFTDSEQFTFFSSFLIFAAFSYFFLEKIEKDALEFKLLNNKLKAKVSQEIYQREEQEQMLLRQYRMASMGEMLDTIAHQWRQPLMHINSILLNMDGAIEAKESRKQNKEFLDKKVDEISSLTNHMSQTIEDFRNLFKIEKEQTSFTLKSVVDNVLELMKNHFHDIDISFKRCDELSIIGNKSELMQVVIIILSNAIEVLKIREIKNKRIQISIQESAEEYLIVIEDNAGGIKPKNIKRIFDPYFTSKKQSGGTGLGLYIADIIIERNIKGRLTAENTASGAMFTIQLGKETTLQT